MASLEQAKKRRAAERGWLVRASKELDELCAQPIDELTTVELESALANFDSRLSRLDAAQESIELLLQLDEIEDEVTAAADFRVKVCKSKIQALLLLDKLRSHVNEGDRSGDYVSVVGASSVRLPKLELPKFSGKFIDWPPFWDQFQAVVHDSDLPTVSKFSYLQALLEGDAKTCIQGLSPTTKHYDIACNLLKERYGRPEKIIFAHIQGLLNLSSPSPKGRASLSMLWKMQDELLSHVRSLEALGISGEKYGLFLTPVILSRLPQEIRMEWTREGEGKEDDLSFLLEFLKKELHRRERSDVFRGVQSLGNDRASVESSTKATPTVSALNTVSKGSNSKKCSFCGKMHPTERCWDLLGMSLSDRHKAIMQTQLCFRCLKPDHFAKSCKQRCTHCNGGHHNYLWCRRKWGEAYDPCHNSKEPNDASSKSPSNSSNTVTSNPSDHGQMLKPVFEEEVRRNFPRAEAAPFDPMSQSEAGLNAAVKSSAAVISPVSVDSGVCSRVGTVLQTAEVLVSGELGVVKATVLFDSGADVSYVSSSLVKKVRPKWMSNRSIAYAAFGAGTGSGEMTRNVYQLNLQGTKHNRDNRSIEAVEVPTICAPPLSRPRVPSEVWEGFENLSFADDYQRDRQVTIDILIGLDFYWSLMKPGAVRKSMGVVAQESCFGWVLSGSWQSSQNNQHRLSQLLCLNDVSEQSLRRFGDLESVGISAAECKSPDPILRRFDESIMYENNRYTVSLPYKCYTDSTVVLSWIRSEPRRWKPFVANRVTEIHELVDPSCWDYCPGDSNPADLLTRGVSAEKMFTSKFWFEGPEWLQVSEPGRSLVNMISVDQLGEEANPISSQSHQSQKNVPFENPFKMERWGTFSKAVRIVAYVLRFIDKLKRIQSHCTPVNEQELTRAKVMLFQVVQREAFPSEFEALRRSKPVSPNSKIGKLTPFFR